MLKPTNLVTIGNLLLIKWALLVLVMLLRMI